MGKLMESYFYAIANEVMISMSVVIYCIELLSITMWPHVTWPQLLLLFDAQIFMFDSHLGVFDLVNIVNPWIHYAPLACSTVQFRYNSSLTFVSPP